MREIEEAELALNAGKVSASTPGAGGYQDEFQNPVWQTEDEGRLLASLERLYLSCLRVILVHLRPWIAIIQSKLRLPIGKLFDDHEIQRLMEAAQLKEEETALIKQILTLIDAYRLTLREILGIREDPLEKGGGTAENRRSERFCRDLNRYHLSLQMAVIDTKNFEKIKKPLGSSLCLHVKSFGGPCQGRHWNGRIRVINSFRQNANYGNKWLPIHHEDQTEIHTVPRWAILRVIPIILSLSYIRAGLYATELASTAIPLIFIPPEGVYNWITLYPKSSMLEGEKLSIRIKIKWVTGKYNTFGLREMQSHYGAHRDLIYQLLNHRIDKEHLTQASGRVARTHMTKEVMVQNLRESPLISSIKEILGEEEMERRRLRLNDIQLRDNLIEVSPESLAFYCTCSEFCNIFSFYYHNPFMNQMVVLDRYMYQIEDDSVVPLHFDAIVELIRSGLPCFYLLESIGELLQEFIKYALAYLGGRQYALLGTRPGQIIQSAYFKLRRRPVIKLFVDQSDENPATFEMRPFRIVSTLLHKIRTRLKIADGLLPIRMNIVFYHSLSIWTIKVVKDHLNATSKIGFSGLESDQSSFAHIRVSRIILLLEKLNFFLHNKQFMRQVMNKDPRQASQFRLILAEFTTDIDNILWQSTRPEEDFYYIMGPAGFLSGYKTKEAELQLILFGIAYDLQNKVLKSLIDEANQSQGYDIRLRQVRFFLDSSWIESLHAIKPDGTEMPLISHHFPINFSQYRIEIANAFTQFYSKFWGRLQFQAEKLQDIEEEAAIEGFTVEFAYLKVWHDKHLQTQDNFRNMLEIYFNAYKQLQRQSAIIIGKDLKENGAKGIAYNFVCLSGQFIRHMRGILRRTEENTERYGLLVPGWYKFFKARKVIIRGMKDIAEKYGTGTKEYEILVESMKVIMGLYDAIYGLLTWNWLHELIQMYDWLMKGTRDSIMRDAKSKLIQLYMFIGLHFATHFYNEHKEQYKVLQSKIHLILSYMKNEQLRTKCLDISEALIKDLEAVGLENPFVTKEFWQSNDREMAELIDYLENRGQDLRKLTNIRMKLRAGIIEPTFVAAKDKNI